MSSNIRIKEFPQDDRRWRVDWLGAVQRGASAANEPFLQAVLSPIDESRGLQSPKELATVRAVDPDQQIVVPIHCGLLPAVSIGSIWRNGVRLPLQAGIRLSYNQLHINHSSLRWVMANHRNGDDYLLPKSHYRYSSVGGRSWLAAIEYGGDPLGLLIPAMELIRFYFATSTKISRSLFMGALQHDSDAVLNADKSGFLEDDYLHLQLRRGFSKEDGWTLGRILTSEVARKAAYRVHDDMMKYHVNKHPVYIRSGFPFEGATNLKAYCKNIPGPARTWRKLILSLDECSANFPFERLAVTLDNNSDRAPPETDIADDDKKPAWVGKQGVKNQREVVKLQNQIPPSTEFSQAEIELPSCRFSAIAGKPIGRLEKDWCEYKSPGKQSLPAQLGNDLSTEGAVGVGQDVGGAELIVSRTREEPLGVSFPAFIKAVEILNMADGITAGIRSEADTPAFLPLFKSPGCAHWAYLDSSSLRRRKIIVADISYKGKWHTLVDFDLRDSDACNVGLIRNLTGGRISAEDLRTLLYWVSVKRGVWDKTSYFHGLPVEISTLKHTWATEEKFAILIQDKLLSCK